MSATRHKIVTTHVHPPIPSRDWDWSAHFDGEEEGGPYGWGCSVHLALLDLHTEVECLNIPDAKKRVRQEAVIALIKTLAQ